MIREKIRETKMIRIKAVDSVPVKERPHDAHVRVLHDNKDVQVVHITIEQGKALRKHITPVDAAFFIIEGVATVEIGDESADVEANTLVHSPAKIPHRVSNNGKERLSFIVIKTPRPTEKTAIL